MAVPEVEPIVDLDAIPLPLAASDLFGQDCSLELEIGCGKGRFLVERGGARPDVGLLGVERARKYLELSARRIRRAALANVRVLHSTAEDVLFRCLGDGSLAAVYVFFPDPWPKKRHHKRRFLRPENVSRIAEVLEPDGRLLVKTDHPAYAEVVAQVLASESLLVPDATESAFAGIAPTSFEIKYERESRAFHRFAYRRRSDRVDDAAATTAAT